MTNKDKTRSSLTTSTKSPQAIFSDIYYHQYFALENRFTNIIPDTVYHYTNLNSLIQILKTKRLWSSRSEAIERFCALLKDPAFSEENELRLLVPDYNSDEFDIQFRSRNNLIVPFIEISLEPVWDDVVVEIIIGPGPDRDIRRENVRHFLELIELGAHVRLSSCQFR